MDVMVDIVNTKSGLKYICVKIVGKISMLFSLYLFCHCVGIYGMKENININTNTNTKLQNDINNNNQDNQENDNENNEEQNEYDPNGNNIYEKIVSPSPQYSNEDKEKNNFINYNISMIPNYVSKFYMIRIRPFIIEEKKGKNGGVKPEFLKDCYIRLSLNEFNVNYVKAVLSNGGVEDNEDKDNNNNDKNEGVYNVPKEKVIVELGKKIESMLTKKRKLLDNQKFSVVNYYTKQEFENKFERDEEIEIIDLNNKNDLSNKNNLNMNINKDNINIHEIIGKKILPENELESFGLCDCCYNMVVNRDLELIKNKKGSKYKIIGKGITLYAELKVRE